MQGFKVTAWNIEHADRLVDALEDTRETTRLRAEERRDAIRAEIEALDCDFLLVSEGPNGEARAQAFFDAVAPDHHLVVRGSSSRRDYGMQGNDSSGRQWLWFLVRKGLPVEAELLHLDRWQAMTETGSQGEHAAGRWDVSLPRIVDGRLEFEIDRRHSHWRHPQVLQVTADGAFFEIVGGHLKSKISFVRPVGHPEDATFFEANPALVADLIKSRVKITTECDDIRYYLDQRFAADASAALIVCGDFNDGPGKERIERRFLYHDLIGTLQGEVFFARRFLNHALFDYEESQRWTVQFRDALDPGRDPNILLDHILFSQAFTGNPQVQPFAFRASRGGGRVEHEVHHAVTGTRPAYALTSDHRPVSMHFERRAPSA